MTDSVGVGVRLVELLREPHRLCSRLRGEAPHRPREGVVGRALAGGSGGTLWRRSAALKLLGLAGELL